VASSSETSVLTRATRRNIPADAILLQILIVHVVSGRWRDRRVSYIVPVSKTRS
jgi:hypothetical protein